MKPVYFPFTYISKMTVDIIASLFNKVIVYQPSMGGISTEMQRLASRGRLDIRVPIQKDEESLEKGLKAYRQWMETNRGTAIEFLKTRRDTVPFFDDLSVAQIRASIKKQIRTEQPSENPAPKKQNRLFAARLFLRLAQELDYQKTAIAQDLTDFQVKEKEMIGQLTGEFEAGDNNHADPDAGAREDPGAYMTRERMGAWAQLYQSDPDKSPIFVTSSPAAVNCLIETTPKIQPLACFDAVQVGFGNTEDEGVQEWKEGLNAQLKRHLNLHWKETSNDFQPVPRIESASVCAPVKISFYLAPQIGPDLLLRPFLEDAPPHSHERGTHTGFENSIIGLVAV